MQINGNDVKACKQNEIMSKDVKQQQGTVSGTEKH